MSTLPSAFLFDLDDTILSLSQTAPPAWQALCLRFGPRLGDTEPDAVFAAIGQTAERFWRDPEKQRWGGRDVERARRAIVAEVFRALQIGDEATAHEMADTFSKERIASIAPFPGAIETLERLRALGRRLALVTNGRARTQREKIDHFALEPHFDCIVVEEEFGVGKPNPRVFRHALEQLGAKPADAWMVGDNLAFDIGGAQQVGIHAIWHDVHGRGLPKEASVRPDRIILRISELLEEGASA